MRVTSIILAAGFALFANAQSSTEGNAPSTTTDAASAAQSSLQAEMIKCLDACQAGDVSCTSKCIAVPNPNESQVNATNTCVAACPKGNGTEADINAYSSCVSGCIASNYYTSSVGTPQPTGSSGNGNGNGSGNNNNGGSSSAGGDSNSNGGATGTGTRNSQASGTATGAASSATSVGAAPTAGLMGVGSAVVGAAGFLAAVMAL
ncbi:hypothetical protein N657DRAFT_629801 [Parathielavia appendiculata]|uniref:Uncharacterized protein n=1 Tax=Parathielavia appendiculata TaxID=2587402 RepID=A0AAN6U993_9PEZI|nr:hypothetical protein N657DRAFT_629801 [Parathielavia appendiculata]